MRFQRGIRESMLAIAFVALSLVAVIQSQKIASLELQILQLQQQPLPSPGLQVVPELPEIRVVPLVFHDHSAERRLNSR